MGTRALRYLAEARSVEVETDGDGNPIAVTLDAQRHLVEVVREEWIIQDQWWTTQPVSRRCFDLVLKNGRQLQLNRSGTVWTRIANITPHAQSPKTPPTTHAPRGEDWGTITRSGVRR